MNSRYADLSTIAPGVLNTRAEVAPRQILSEMAQTWDYIVTQGERVDQIAYEALGDSRLWWLIADLNPLVDTQFLVGGTVLTMPGIEVLA